MTCRSNSVSVFSSSSTTLGVDKADYFVYFFCRGAYSSDITGVITVEIIPDSGGTHPCIFYIPKGSEDEVLDMNPADEELLAALEGYI